MIHNLFSESDDVVSSPCRLDLKVQTAGTAIHSILPPIQMLISVWQVKSQWIVSERKNDSNDVDRLIKMKFGNYCLGDRITAPQPNSTKIVTCFLSVLGYQTNHSMQTSSIHLMNILHIPLKYGEVIDVQFFCLRRNFLELGTF